MGNKHRTPPTDTLHDYTEAAAIIGLSVPRLRQLRASGEIPHIKNPLTRAVRFRRTDLDAYLARRAQGVLHQDGRRKNIPMDHQ